jgi:VIT1/CCC1 family predicted Fe2+/Mn2+ transporter
MIREITLSKYLEPGESLSEILFGLIMTLTFTTGAGLMVHESPDAVRQLLVATIGCNIAWGIIDAAFYVSGRVFERSRLARLGELIRQADGEEQAAAVVESELGELMELVVDPGERRALYRRMAQHVRSSEERPGAITGADLRGALASFWMVFFASIPAAVPFLVMHEAWLALRISNAILVILLFLTGFLWARYTRLRPWLTGTTFLFAGLALVAVAVALGG